MFGGNRRRLFANMSVGGEDESRVEINAGYRQSEDGTSNIIVQVGKRTSGVVKMVTFATTIEGEVAVIQRGTLIGDAPFEFEVLKGLTSQDIIPDISVVSYGPLGRKPVLEFGPDFEGANKPFRFWTRQKVFRRV